MVTIAVNQW